MKRKIYYLLSPKWRFLIRRLYYLPIDIYETFTGKRDDLMPPRGLIFVGSGNFKAIGKQLLENIILTCKIRPNSHILDVGCGIGRLAIPLTQYLNHQGRYEGFDLVKIGIEWCKKNISSRYPNFNFQHINLKNDLYNITANEAKNFVFPYPNEQFDLVVLTSVFTHMLPDEVDNYLSQIHRVLKKGGYCYVTFFLINPEIEHLIKNKKDFNFPYNYGNYRLMDNKVKEANVAYNETYLTNQIFPKHHLHLEQKYYGWWSGNPKESSLGFQDTVILRK